MKPFIFIVALSFLLGQNATENKPQQTAPGKATTPPKKKTMEEALKNKKRNTWIVHSLSRSRQWKITHAYQRRSA